MRQQTKPKKLVLCKGLFKWKKLECVSWRLYILCLRSLLLESIMCLVTGTEILSQLRMKCQPGASSVRSWRRSWGHAALANGYGDAGNFGASDSQASTTPGEETNENVDLNSGERADMPCLHQMFHPKGWNKLYLTETPLIEFKVS